MCNLYSLTKGQAAIVELTRAMRDRADNLPPMPGIFPDYLAPIVRNAPDGARGFMTTDANAEVAPIHPKAML